MLEPSLMNQNEISLEVTNAVFARILFSACWNIVWCIKTNFLFKYFMQWLQESELGKYRIAIRYLRILDISTIRRHE